MRAAAIAAGGFGLAQLASGVGGSGERQGTGEEREVEYGPDGKSAETAKHGRRHTREVCGEVKKKPIGQSY